MVHPFATQIRPDVGDMLWHLCDGQMPLYTTSKGKEVGWIKTSHRGVQFMDKVSFPRKEKRYIFSSKFEIRYDTKFREVLQHCADLSRGDRDEGRTWITPAMFDGYWNLYQAGFAHSYETWQDGKLVGGCIGVHIGGYISCDTMFHLVSNASKAAWGRTIVYLQERGFTWADTNCVASHHVNYGEEWVPQWRFEQMMREAIARPVAFLEGQAPPQIPVVVRWGLPTMRLLSRAGRGIRRLIKLRQNQAAAGTARAVSG